MQFDPGEREYLMEMRGLTTDAEGREIYVGLSVDESAEFFAMHRADGLEWRPGDTMGTYSDRKARFLELHDRYERARMEVLGAESVLRHMAPTVN